LGTWSFLTASDGAPSSVLDAKYPSSRVLHGRGIFHVGMTGRWSHGFLYDFA